MSGIFRGVYSVLIPRIGKPHGIPARNDVSVTDDGSALTVFATPSTGKKHETNIRPTPNHVFILVENNG